MSVTYEQKELRLFFIYKYINTLVALHFLLSPIILITGFSLRCQNIKLCSDKEGILSVIRVCYLKRE